MPADYATLSDAIAALQSTGGTICLGAATYVELPLKGSYDASAPITIQGVSSAKSIVKLER